MPVNMGDWWFDIATVNHFWIRRRFDVMRQLAGNILSNSKSAAEVGCGHGLLQKEIEDRYGMAITGFDLNELALRNNVSRLSPLYCYDINQRNPDFAARFDLMLLFDVLEHIDEEGDFLQAVKFHLKDSGILLINVPAFSFFYSDYDRAAGHVRRYSIKDLTKVGQENGFKVRALTYWGLPLVPLLLARKGIRMRRGDGRAGFDSKGTLMNTMLSYLAKCEPLPQKLLGTSVMAVFENHGESGCAQ